MSKGYSGKLVLGGDIGGTKTNLGTYAAGEDRPALVAMESYPSTESKDLESLISRFVEAHPDPISAACFGVAGPVLGGVCKATNLPWVVSEDSIKERFGWERVRLVNDLVATANSIAVLDRGELEQLNAGSPDPEGNLGLVAPGTGLGISFMVRREGKLHAASSEGGHVDFAPQTAAQIELLGYLSSKYGHVSIERAASGPGLYDIFQWLRGSRSYGPPDWLEERLEQEDPPRVVSEVGIARQDPLCVEALDMFVSVLGAAAGNFALTVFATGGIYLGGGISPKILPKLSDGTFMKSFAAKGRFEELLMKVPVHVILNDKAALMGAGCCALDL